MALTTTPVFPQTPKTAGVAFAASSETTQMDPATVNPTALVTAGSNGALITSLVYTAEVTSALEKVVLWVDPDGTDTAHYILAEKLQVAYTMAPTTVQVPLTFVDKTDPNSAIRLAAGAIVGLTHHIDQQAMAVAEYTDF